MATLSVSAAWNETAAFVARERRLLFPLAFMLTALPAALLDLVMPPPPAPGQLPQAGLWLAAVPLTFIAAMIGNIALSVLSLRPGLSVAEALGRGLRRFPILLAVVLLLMIAGALLLFVAAMVAVLVTPGALDAAKSGVPTPATGTAALLMLAIVLPALLYVGARLTVLTPLAANEDSGPLAMIGRSWRLTAGYVWRLIGFLVLAGLLVGVLSTAVQSVAGLLSALILGSIAPGSPGALLVILVMLVVNTVIGAYLAVLIARIYAQLAERTGSET